MVPQWLHTFAVFFNVRHRGYKLRWRGIRICGWLGFLMATVSPKFWGCSLYNWNHLYCNRNCTTAQELDAPEREWCAEGSVFMACSASCPCSSSDIGRFLKWGNPKPSQNWLCEMRSGFGLSLFIKKTFQLEGSVEPQPMFLPGRIVYASIILMYFQTWCNCLRNDSCVRLQQSNCAAVEMTIFSTKGAKIFSTRVASFTSCGLSQDWSTSWVNIGQLLEADFGHSLYSCSHPIFWGPAIWSIPKPERKMNSESHDFGTAFRPASKNILQIGPSTPCSVCATSGGDFETSYNFYCIRSPM